MVSHRETIFLSKRKANAFWSRVATRPRAARLSASAFCLGCRCHLMLSRCRLMTSLPLVVAATCCDLLSLAATCCHLPLQLTVATVDVCAAVLLWRAGLSHPQVRTRDL
jgi:hypothetical protein